MMEVLSLHRGPMNMLYFWASTMWFLSCVVGLGGLTMVLTAAGDAGAQAPEHDRFDTLRVLTYNLHGLLDDQPNPDWDPVRTAWLADAIENLDPDVVGFQEVLQHAGSDGSDNQIRTLADTLSRRTGSRWQVRSEVAHPSWERFDEGIAILTRHPIVRTDEYMLKARDEYPRNLISARILTPIGVIDFFTTHLAHRAEAEATREAQVSEIRQHVGERQAGEPPAVITGDFNAGPDQPSIQSATAADSAGRWVDAFEMLNPGAAGYTYSAGEPHRRIDYVFVSDTVSISPVRAEVVFGEARGGKKLSDHLGVVADFVRR